MCPMCSFCDASLRCALWDSVRLERWHSREHSCERFRCLWDSLRLERWHSTCNQQESQKAHLRLRSLSLSDMRGASALERLWALSRVRESPSAQGLCCTWALNRESLCCRETALNCSGTLTRLHSPVSFVKEPVLRGLESTRESLSSVHALLSICMRSAESFWALCTVSEHSHA